MTAPEPDGAARPGPAAPASDAPHTNAPHTDAPHTDAPHTDAPHTDAPHADAPHADAPHAGAPQAYDPHAFEPFAVTVDLAVFTVRGGALHVLLIRRGRDPYAGAWALPGGFVLPRESAETAALRELAEETGLAPEPLGALHLEQLRTYSEPDRDPRMRVVSVAFTALVPDLPEPAEDGGGDADRARWVPVAQARGLAFDHGLILADARRRVGAKLEYTCLATAFCPPEFTLGELQAVYETVWDTGLDRPNFRRKVLATPGFVEAVPGAARLTGGRGKPAALYRAGPATTLHPPLLRPTEGPTP